ncbi:MAG: hypothetical protein MUE41_00575 [Gemmatimonadaceae bacterium]|jgi:hypothetical protein|nr:hypothetical protein [Gemmatimonadaceae bacterium]
MVLAASLLTACSDSGDVVTSPILTGSERGASVTTDSVTSRVRGPVASPRARLKALLSAEPDFAERCTGVALVSTRLAETMGCDGALIAKAAGSARVTEPNPELEAMQAEVDQLLWELDQAWNQSPYARDGAAEVAGVASTANPCSDRLAVALGAVAMATVDVAAFGLASAHGNVPVASMALGWLRVSIPAAVGAVTAYATCDPNGGGGNNGGKGYR